MRLVANYIKLNNNEGGSASVYVAAGLASDGD